MKKLLILTSILFAVISCEVLTGTGDETKPEEKVVDPWSTAYLASWHHESPGLPDSLHQIPTSEIEWQAFTHLSYFGLTIAEDGSLVPVKQYQTMEEIGSQIDDIVSAAHARDVAVLLSIGGWQSRENFINTIASGNQDTLITALREMLEIHGIDGIDLNIEPLEETDASYYEKFVDELHTELQSVKTPLLDRPLLTAATTWQSDLFGRIHPRLDQVNIMTYNYSNAWEGWLTWHNSPIYNGGHAFPGENGFFPSVDDDVERFLEAGVPRAKIGIGIDFYGYIWTGEVNAPLQDWSTSPDVREDVPYYMIMDSLYAPEYFVWDDEVKAAYLSIKRPDSVADSFVSFEEERAVRAKIRYREEKRIGGIFVWEVSGGYRAGEAAGSRNPLQKAIKEALNESTNKPR